MAIAMSNYYLALFIPTESGISFILYLAHRVQTKAHRAADLSCKEPQTTAYNKKTQTY